MRPATLAIIGFLIGAYFAYTDAPGVSTPEQRPAPTEAPTPIAPPRPVAIKSPSSSSSTIRSVSIAANPDAPNDPHLVQFRVVDGLAVAFGDVILGKVEDGFSGKTGYYEPSTTQLWDNPVIPYSIDPSLPNPKRVEAAISYFNQNTPVHFVPYQGEADAVVFVTGTDNCLSVVGRQGGLQPIKLSDTCQTQDVLHEMLHALGFIHEQMRPDRDNSVEILWDNIEEKYRSQYAIAPDALFGPMRDTPFDFNSIMLYRTNEFAVSPKAPTMRSKTGTPIAPVTKGLSPEDVQRLYKLFRLGDPPH